MTEVEWLACEDPVAALGYAWQSLSLRKQNLILCALCRNAWEHLTMPARRLLMLYERFVEARTACFDAERGVWCPEGAVPDSGRLPALDGELQQGIRLAEEAARTAEDVAVILTAFDESGKYEDDIIRLAAGRSSGYHHEPGRNEGVDAEDRFARELAAGAGLTRDIFGNPFCPATFDPAWRTDTAVALARGMYESRDFGAMPILADALQDAGCDSDDILNHCRGEGPHVRGCWVVDLVLGKE